MEAQVETVVSHTQRDTIADGHLERNRPHISRREIRQRGIVRTDLQCSADTRRTECHLEEGAQITTESSGFGDISWHQIEGAERRGRLPSAQLL